MSKSIITLRVISIGLICHIEVIMVKEVMGLNAMNLYVQGKPLTTKQPKFNDKIIDTRV